MTPSQCAEIIRHVTELFDHLGIAEVPGSRIARAAEHDRANMALLAVIGDDKRKGNVVRHFLP
jgi:hypothetical protein